jgi:hypothetical protein
VPPPPPDKPEGEAGGAPGRPGRKPFLLRLSPEVMEELRAWAGHEMRSLNAHIEYLLREAVKRRKADAARKGEKP